MWSSGSIRSSARLRRARAASRRRSATGDPRPAQGYLHAGPSGAGHFVKMIHNGIEYGMMQAYAEGFDILKHAGDAALPAEHRLDLNVADIAEVWRHGSVVTSWLLDLTAAALAEDGELASYSGHVADSGEGRWTIQAAIEEAVPADVLSAALYARFRSRQDHTFAEKILSAMRKGFGGHQEPKVRWHGRRVPRSFAAIVVMGVSGAGKSTVGKLIAARLDCPFRDADSFHPPGQHREDEPRRAAHRRGSLAVAARDCGLDRRASRGGHDCVVTCSALKRVYRDIVTDKQSADVRLVYLKGDFEPDRGAAQARARATSCRRRC